MTAIILSAPIYASTVNYEDELKLEALNQSIVETRDAILNVEDEIDIAYQNMLDRENYIVDLINKLDTTSTSFSNWQYNLEYLKNNYDMIANVPAVNMQYVDTYIEQYTYTLKTMELPEEQESGISARASYSRSAATEYALDYLEYYNSSYPDWSNYGDCANFVSQCLYAGGKSMKGTPGTSSAAQNWDNWFSKGSSQSTVNVSSTWRGAAAFRDYWQRNASGYKKFTSMNSSAYSYGYRGDAISLLNSNGAAYHTLMIVGYGSTDFKIAAHSDGLVYNG